LRATVDSGLITIRVAEEEGEVVSSDVRAEIEGIELVSLIDAVTFDGTYNLFIEITDEATQIGIESVEVTNLVFLHCG